MKNKTFRNALISGVLAVLSGVVLFGASAAFGADVPTSPPGDGVSPTFTGLNIDGGDITVTGGSITAEEYIASPSGRFSEISHKEDDEALVINDDLSVFRDIDTGRHINAEGNISKLKNLNADDGIFSGDQIIIFDGDLAEYKALKNAEDTLGIARKTGAIMDPEPQNLAGFGNFTRMDMTSMLWNFLGPVNIGTAELPVPLHAYWGIIDALQVSVGAVFTGFAGFTEEVLFQGPVGFEGSAIFDDFVSIYDYDGNNDAKLIVDKIESSDGGGEGLLFNTKIKGPDDELTVKGTLYAENFGRIYNVNSSYSHKISDHYKTISVSCENPNDIILSCNLENEKYANSTIHGISYPSQSQCSMAYRELPINSYIGKGTWTSYLRAKCWDMNGDGAVVASGDTSGTTTDWTKFTNTDHRFVIPNTFEPGTTSGIYEEMPLDNRPFDNFIIDDSLMGPLDQLIDPLWDPVPTDMSSQTTGLGL